MLVSVAMDLTVLFFSELIEKELGLETFGNGSFRQ